MLHEMSQDNIFLEIDMTVQTRTTTTTTTAATTTITSAAAATTTTTKSLRPAFSWEWTNRSFLRATTTTTITSLQV